MEIFDRKSLTSSQLTPLFEKVNLIYDNQKERFIRYALPANVSIEDVIKYIDSNNRVSNEYGLLRARYYPTENFIPVIERNIAHYPDDLRLSALRTLSVMGGRPFGIDDLANVVRTGKVLNAQLKTYDCVAFKKKTPAQLKEIDRPELNFCIRRYAREQYTGYIRMIEENSELMPSPILESDKRWVKELFDRNLDE